MKELLEFVDVYHANCVEELMASKTDDGISTDILEQIYDTHKRINEILKTDEYLYNIKKRQEHPEAITSEISFGRIRR